MFHSIKRLFHRVWPAEKVNWVYSPSLMLAIYRGELKLKKSA